jgi:hypothetical protein
VQDSGFALLAVSACELLAEHPDFGLEASNFVESGVEPLSCRFR